MPTYQYACTECGHAFDQVQSFSDDSLTVCPVCSGRLRKVFNAVGVVFKGSGFYRNDSRGSQSTSEPAASTSSSSDSGSGSSGSGSDAGSTTPAPKTSDSGSSSTPASSGSGSSSTSGSGSSST